ncbi:VanW family protein [Candidatus Parcubacteria bacterium]|nr:VanW family protein [Candidatus Parcubacteria bacterium]
MRMLRTALAVFLLVGLGLAMLMWANSGLVARGVRVGDLSFGGLTRREAAALLEARASRFGAAPFIFTFETRSASTTPAELGLSLDAEATLTAIWQAGHNPNPLWALGEQIELFLKPRRVGAVYRLDGLALERFLKERFGDLEQPAREPALMWQGNTLAITPGKIDLMVDRATFKAHLARAAEELRYPNPPFTVPAVSRAPVTTETQLARVRADAYRILNAAPFRFSAGGRTLAITKDVLKPWLTLTAPDGGLEPDAVRGFLSDLAPSVHRDPSYAYLTEQNGILTESTPSRNGADLLIEENVPRITRHILEASPDVLSLLVAEKSAAVSVERLHELGITALLGRGETDFKGSTPARSHNIKVAAARYNGLAIPAGATFSFSETIGPIDATTGYQVALVIKNGKTVPEYGGGVCQVSTTMFRAAVTAGLEILKRFPHAYPVLYYGTPQGFDATIYPGGPDLTFRNDTAKPILIQARVEGTRLTVDFFGAPDGREVTLDGPHEFEKNPDGSLKARLTQIVSRNGELIRKKTFWSNYKSPALYPIERNPLE